MLLYSSCNSSYISPSPNLEGSAPIATFIPSSLTCTYQRAVLPYPIWFYWKTPLSPIDVEARGKQPVSWLKYAEQSGELLYSMCVEVGTH